MTTTLRNSRLTLIAGQSFFVQHWRAAVGPRSAPWRWHEYSWTFNQIRSGQIDPDFDFPWRSSQRSAYWSTYLSGQKLGTVRAESAWQAMVPLRITGQERPQIGTDNPAERVLLDVYAYPHGLVAALTVQSPQGLSEGLDAWRDRTRRLRLDRPFTLALPGTAPRAGLKADEALEASLDWFRERYFGAVDEVFTEGEPFTIGAAIQGQGVNPTAPVSPSLHRTLHAVTAWPVNWKTASLPDLKTHCLPVRSSKAEPGDALYAVGRGRTLWRPGLFTKISTGKADRIHTLSCLAHNMVASSVQAESLRLFAKGFQSSPTARAQLSPEFASTAARLLHNARMGESTYRSSSIARLIEDPNSKAEVNALLAEHGHAQF